MRELQLLWRQPGHIADGIAILIELLVDNPRIAQPLTTAQNARDIDGPHDLPRRVDVVAAHEQHVRRTMRRDDLTQLRRRRRRKIFIGIEENQPLPRGLRQGKVTRR